MGWLALYTVVLVDFWVSHGSACSLLARFQIRRHGFCQCTFRWSGGDCEATFSGWYLGNVPFLDVGLEWVRHWGVLGQQVPIFGITTLWSDLDIKMSVTLWKFWIHIVNLLCQWNSFLFLDYGWKLKLKSMPWFLKDNICMWKLNEMA